MPKWRVVAADLFNCARAGIMSARTRQQEAGSGREIRKCVR
jgi:hypothetical protein